MILRMYTRILCLYSIEENLQFYLANRGKHLGIRMNEEL